MQRPAQDTGSSFMQRLGYYALGISVGLFFLVWIQMQKSKMKQANTPAAPAQVESGPPVDAQPQAPTDTLNDPRP